MKKTYSQKVARFFEIFEYILLLPQIGFIGLIISNKLKSEAFYESIANVDSSIWFLMGMMIFTILFLVMHSFLSRREVQPAVNLTAWILTFLVYAPISLFILYLGVIFYVVGMLNMTGQTIGSLGLYLVTGVLFLLIILPITVFFSIYNQHKMSKISSTL